MTQAQSGDKVKLHYTGTLQDGSVFDSSEGRDPLEFTLGANQVIPGFENAVVGMTPGDSKTVNIPADQAYGHRNEEMVLEVPPEQFPDNMEPRLGDQLQIRQPDGSAVNVVVSEVSEASVKLDANHPLAGEALTFKIDLVAIN